MEKVTSFGFSDIKNGNKHKGDVMQSHTHCVKQKQFCPISGDHCWSPATASNFSLFPEKVLFLSQVGTQKQSCWTVCSLGTALDAVGLTLWLHQECVFFACFACATPMNSVCISHGTQSLTRLGTREVAHSQCQLLTTNGAHLQCLRFTVWCCARLNL